MTPVSDGKPLGPSKVFREAVHLLMDSLDYESTLARVAALALPEFGAWSIVDVCEPSGTFRRVAIVHPDPAMQKLARMLQHSWPPQTADPIGIPAVVRTGAPQVVSRVTDQMLIEVARDEENLALLRQLEIPSFIAAPLIARGDILGAITFVSGPDRLYTEDDINLAEDLAAVSAMAIEHARIHREAHEARARAADRAELAERQHRDLEQIMEVQARLVRGFSHDVKNPLGAAQGHAKLLEEGILQSLTPEQTKSVQRIGSAIDTAITLIDDLVKYTSTGRINISATHHDDGDAPWPGEWVAVAVTDTGRGIPPESHELVFEEFARLEPEAVQGAGLGLAMSRWIAELLGARITLKSAVGRGSTFTLWLPMEPPGDGADEAAGATPSP